ncbi:MAG: glycerate kinase [Actinobacteria bacterium]|nr:glycerate kinase [Actinomycetota bacterium]
MLKKIVIACDKYKGNLTALQVCSIIQMAAADVGRQVETVINPMADGGEGTVDTLVESYGGNYVETEVRNPIGEIIKARFGLIENGKTAIIEMSSASGLALIPQEKRNPLHTTTFGTGQLIKKALDSGCRKIIIGIGGSATNDGGVGAAQALGINFMDINKIPVGSGGKELIKINGIDISGAHPAIRNSEIMVACDVDNPLLGKKGAAYVYGPQKGADRETVRILDRGLAHFAGIVKKELGIDVRRIKGAGAAGGLGAGLVAFLNAKLLPGTDLIISATGLEEKIKNADLVITGEGSMDNQTFYGKSSYGVAVLAKKYGVPVITINGSVNIDYDKIEKDKQDLFCGNFDTVNREMTLDQAIDKSREMLYFTARQLVSFYSSVVLKCN